jgi:hypothetical protein
MDQVLQGCTQEFQRKQRQPPLKSRTVNNS